MSVKKRVFLLLLAIVVGVGLVGSGSSLTRPILCFGDGCGATYLPGNWVQELIGGITSVVGGFLAGLGCVGIIRLVRSLEQRGPTDHTTES